MTNVPGLWAERFQFPWGVFFDIFSAEDELKGKLFSTYPVSKTVSQTKRGWLWTARYWAWIWKIMFTWFPHLRILSAFSICQNIWSLMISYKSMPWSIPETTEAIQLKKILKNICVWLQELVMIKKSICQEIKLDDKHCDASEHRANIGIYFGNQKHPKLLRRTHYFINMF